MTRGDELRAEAAIHEREAARLNRKALGLAKRGCVFSAEDCDELAMRERAAAGMLNVSAMNQDA